jgi:hypothetical protein
MTGFAAGLAVLLFASTSLAALETAPIEPPARAADMDVRWMQVRVPDLGFMVLAIAHRLFHSSAARNSLMNR